VWFKPIIRKNVFFPWKKKEGAIKFFFELIFFLIYGWSALEEGSFEVSKDLKVAKFGGYRWWVGLYTA